jgi:hypothetical protein
MVLTPNPTAAGTFPEYSFTRLRSCGSPEFIVPVAPVTPMRDTTYMNESASLQRSFIRFSEVAGAINGTYDSL